MEGIDLQDIEAGDVSLPSGADLARAWRCTTLSANTELFSSWVGDASALMATGLSTLTGRDGIPRASSLGARILSDSLQQSGLADHDQAYRAASLGRKLDREGQWKTTATGSGLGRSPPVHFHYLHHLAWASAADRLPAYLLPHAYETDMEKPAAAVSHAW